MFQTKEGETGITLGSGILGWPPSERESGRYGLVTLWTEPSSILSVDYIPEKRIPFKVYEFGGNKRIYCDLFAMILEEREFKNTGDPHRDLRPTRVEVGTEVKLGRGLLWYAGDKAVGICPIPYTEDNFWMDPKELYKVVDQFVIVYIIPNPV